MAVSASLLVGKLINKISFNAANLCEYVVGIEIEKTAVLIPFSRILQKNAE